RRPAQRKEGAPDPTGPCTGDGCNSRARPAQTATAASRPPRSGPATRPTGPQGWSSARTARQQWGKRPETRPPARGSRPDQSLGSLRLDQREGLPLGHVFHADRIDAVTQAGRGRAVGKDVAQMTVTTGTAHLGADHAVGTVLIFLDRIR